MNNPIILKSTDQGDNDDDVNNKDMHENTSCGDEAINNNDNVDDECLDDNGKVLMMIFSKTVDHPTEYVYARTSTQATQMQENDNGAAETSKNYNKNYLNDNFL